MLRLIYSVLIACSSRVLDYGNTFKSLRLNVLKGVCWMCQNGFQFCCTWQRLCNNLRTRLEYLHNDRFSIESCVFSIFFCLIFSILLFHCLFLLMGHAPDLSKYIHTLKCRAHYWKPRGICADAVSMKACVACRSYYGSCDSSIQVYITPVYRYFKRGAFARYRGN
jgi:hypothetical protein